MNDKVITTSHADFFRCKLTWIIKIVLNFTKKKNILILIYIESLHVSAKNNY